jgi:hypothetical protein
MPCNELLDNLRRAIRRGVIHDHDFVGCSPLFRQRFQAVVKQFLLVIGRHNNSDHLTIREVVRINVFGRVEEHIFQVAAPTVFVKAAEGVPDLQIADKPDFVAVRLYLR